MCTAHRPHKSKKQKDGRRGASESRREFGVFLGRKSQAYNFVKANEGCADDSKKATEDVVLCASVVPVDPPIRGGEKHTRNRFLLLHGFEVKGKSGHTFADLDDMCCEQMLHLFGGERESESLPWLEGGSGGGHGTATHRQITN